VRQGWLNGPGSIVDAREDGDGGDSSQANGARGTKRKAVHLNPHGAAALDAGAALPETLAKLVHAGRVRWASGLRQPAREHARTARKRDESWFRFAELFAGIGGFRVGLEPLGGECVFASELDDVACRIYAHNHGGDHPAGDITGLCAESVGAHDILTAGFPCQPFSQCGEAAGMLDQRGQLFFEVVRVACRWRPKALLLENVSNLARTNGGADLECILRVLTDVGYTVSARVVNSAALLAQRRNRLYFIAFRNDLHAAIDAFRWPELPERLGASGARVRSLLEADAAVPSSYTVPPRTWASICAKLADPLAKRCVALDGQARTLMSSYRRSPLLYSQFVLRAPPLEGWRGADSGAPGADGSADGSDEADEASEGAAAGVADAPSAARGRADGVGASGHESVTVRFFTERECCRLQGFDDSFEVANYGQMHRAYHCVGNAVCPPVVRELAKSILAALLAGARAGAPTAQAAAEQVDALFPALQAGGVSVPFPAKWSRRASNAPATE
jgi:DNA-cytosine methyltransferase